MMALVISVPGIVDELSASAGLRGALRPISMQAVRLMAVRHMRTKCMKDRYGMIDPALLFVKSIYRHLSLFKN
jgi:hypothetical protein